MVFRRNVENSCSSSPGGSSRDGPFAGLSQQVHRMVTNLRRGPQQFLEDVVGSFHCNNQRNRVNRTELFTDLFPTADASSSATSPSYKFQFGEAPRPRARQPLFASISGSRAGNEVYSLALTPKQMAPALEGVPVWTVTNKENEFVLVSQTAEDGKQLGFFCFNERDAEILLKQVNGHESGISGGGQVVPLTLDKMVALSSGNTPATAGIAFRLIPDAQEVHQALKITAQQGAPLERFPGVPVFAVQGLTILGTNNKKHVPLFLSARDVEVAVGAAKEGPNSPDPTVETGSLETVLQRMKDSPMLPEWSQMVLIPSLKSREALFSLTGGEVGTKVGK